MVEEVLIPVRTGTLLKDFLKNRGFSHLLREVPNHEGDVHLSEKVWIPMTLFDGSDLGIVPQYIYITICVFWPPSIKALSEKTGLTRQTVARNCKLLERHGWLTFVGKGRGKRPVPIVPKVACARWIETVQMSQKYVSYKGEWLMKLWLDLLIASDEFIDNARPLFLKNPTSDQPLEYDRLYYRHRVAFEHNGSQHYRPTKMYPDPKAQQEQESRDLIKEALSARHSVELVTITAEDLTYEGMLEKIPKSLPLTGITKDDPRVVFLEKLCRAYRKMDRG